MFKSRGDLKVQDFTCMGQFVTMAFLQVTCRESPRDIEGNLRAQAKQQHHMRLRCNTVSRDMPLNGIATQ